MARKEPIVHDLDILRPSPEYVKLGGNKIDISFIPSGIALDIVGMREELEALTDTPEKLKTIEKGGKEALKTFDISATMCAMITEKQYPELDKEWLLKNTDVNQLKILIELITQSVFKSLEGIQGEESKNSEAVKQLQ